MSVHIQTLEFTTEKFPHQHHSSFVVGKRSSSKKNAKDLRNPVSYNIGFLLRSRREGTEKRDNSTAPNSLIPLPPPKGLEGVDALGSQTCVSLDSFSSFLVWPRGQAVSRTKSS